MKFGHWGERERAPHRRVKCARCTYVVVVMNAIRLSFARAAYVMHTQCAIIYSRCRMTKQRAVLSRICYCHVLHSVRIYTYCTALYCGSRYRLMYLTVRYTGLSYTLWVPKRLQRRRERESARRTSATKGGEIERQNTNPRQSSAQTIERRKALLRVRMGAGVCPESIEERPDYSRCSGQCGKGCGIQTV
jgi:hypothetical protein